MQRGTIGLILCALLLSSCASTKSKGCDMSATDSCLTMDAVNAMTEEKGSYAKKNAFSSTVRRSEQMVWIAPQDEENSHA